MNIVLEGERIILRKLRPSDAESIWLNARDKEISRYMTNLPYPYKLKDAKQFIGRSIGRSKAGKKLNLGLALKESGQVVGVFSLTLQKNLLIAETGYWIGKKYWRQGFGSEALQLILKFGFKNLKLKKIFAKVLKGNPSSAVLLEKNGFKFEGCLRKQTLLRGRWYDYLMYGMLKEEFKEK
jgi:RimJ/RimL family protein N-acetyltransferase